MDIIYTIYKKKNNTMSMKYLKAFENFKINENDSETDLEQVITQKAQSLSDEEKEKVRVELSDLAKKLGLSPEDMTDPNKVGEALAKQQGELGEVSESLNEGLRDWWGRVKNQFFKWLTRIGVGGMVGGMISAAVGANAMEAATNLADYVPDSIVEPNTAIIVGGIAFAIGILATVIGLQNQKFTDLKTEISPERAQRIIAQRKARGRR